AQVRQHLASQPDPVDPRLLAEATVDWLDPHGLWSASPDAPLAAFLKKHEKEFLAELEAPPFAAGGWRVANEAGTLLTTWMTGLVAIHDEAALRARPVPRPDAWRIASEPVFEDRVVEKPGRELAKSLGRAAGVLSATFGAPLQRFVDAARARF